MVVVISVFFWKWRPWISNGRASGISISTYFHVMLCYSGENVEPSTWFLVTFLGAGSLKLMGKES